MVSTSKKRSSIRSSEGGETSANYMIKEAGKNNTMRNKSTQKDSVVGRFKQKVKGVKDKVVDNVDKTAAATTRKAKSTVNNSINNRGRKYEKGSADTETPRVRDPTKEYEAKEPMSPAKIKQHKPTAVRRNASDQKIIELE